MPQYREKPVIVEAVQWTGDPECLRGTVLNREPWIYARANKGDWIVQNETGNIVRYSHDIFTATYEPVTVDKVSEEAVDCGAMGLLISRGFTQANVVAMKTSWLRSHVWTEARKAARAVLEADAKGEG